MSYPVWYTRRMIIKTDMKENREKGPVFQVEDDERMASQWLLRAAPPHKVGAEIWMGWLPRDEFHVECVSKEFIEKVLG
jgi:hypothetical protein